MENITVNGELIMVLTDKQDWLRKIPRHLPEERPGEQRIWVDRNGFIFERGLDFDAAEKLDTYPCKIYRLFPVHSQIPKP